jgi:hypothetical protein
MLRLNRELGAFQSDLRLTLGTLYCQIERIM